MSRSITIVQTGGNRSLPENAFPLRIGRDASADFRVPGAVTQASTALIGLLDGRIFLQPADLGLAIKVNGEAVTATRWLGDGDVVTAAALRIQCEFDDESWRFIESRQAIEFDTVPPAAPGDSSADGAISPVRTPALETEPAPPARRPIGRYVLFGTLGVLLLFAGFLFSAKAVRFNVEPADADINIAGGLFKFQFGGRYLLRPGDYRIILKAPGYEPLRKEFAVTAKPSQELDFVMARLPGRVVVTTRPAVPAEVSVDGQARGTAPTGEIELAAGPHQLSVVAERYQPYDETVEVEGRGILQPVEIELSPDFATVEISSTPPGAAIFADDLELGETPATIELMSGKHELVLRKDGYKSTRQTLSVAANEALRLPDIALAEADGILSVISAPAGAAVNIDGRYRGRTPLEAELRPDRRYEVRVSKPGFASATKPVQLESRAGKTLRFQLEARTGVVSIASEPAGADVYIDGKSAGAAPLELTLPARPHRIEARRAGFESRVEDVTPKPGLPQVLTIRLLTPEQAILAATPQTITTSQGATMRLIQAGQFEMGAPRREQGRRPNETQRTVKLTRPFYFALRETTNSEYRQFVSNHTSGAEKYRELANGDHPAVMMSWEEAAAFCNWLSDKDGLAPAYRNVGGKLTLAEPYTTGYRMPTEAEWAWVARYNGGGAKLKYAWGNAMPPSEGAGNFADVSASSILADTLSSYDDGYPVTSPVGRFKPSPLGIFDLGGNVAEWTSDRYSVNFGDQKIIIDPMGSDDAQYHVIRGSGWRHASISELRLAFRDFGDRGRLDIGIRLARFADEANQ